MKSIYIKMDNPTMRQRIIIVIANFNLWLICWLFKDNQDKMGKEAKEVIINAYKAL